MNVVKISKKMSFILRHKPESIGATLDPQGWISTELLLKGLKTDLKTLQHVVETNNKKRFEFNEDQTMIRASQGHSQSVELGYEPSVPPDVLFHGTVKAFTESIFKDGLSKMARHHVHLSKDVETATSVGSRRGEPVILSVNAKAMHEAGHEFFLSTNGVWLTDTVPANFISLGL